MSLRLVLSRALKAGYNLLDSFCLAPLVVANSLVGGATDSQHFMGLGLDLGSLITPKSSPASHVPSAISWKGGTDGYFHSMLKASLPASSQPARSVLMHAGVVRPMGFS